MKRFSCFSQSQPVSAHVIVPLPVAGLVRKQLRAVMLILGLGLDCTGLGKMFKTICLEPLFCILS